MTLTLFPSYSITDLCAKSAALFLTAALVVSMVPANADHADSANWQLDTQGSQISFVTVKAGDIAEVHSLSKLSGNVSFGEGHSGEVNLDIHLESVETNIPIRNERILEFLFEVARFPLAEVHGHVPASAFLELAAGESTSASLPLRLDLHGESIAINAEVLVMRVANDRVMVTSTQPIIVNAASVGLVAGIDKLQQLASLPSISKAVPVSFVLSFTRQK